MVARACFSFDNLGAAAGIGAGEGRSDAPDPAHPSLVVGLPRLLDRLDRRGVRASFFVEGWNGLHHPEAVAEIVRRGHELGMHGFVHERWSALAPDAERALAERATEALTRAAGVAPRGFRAPGGARSANTVGILRALGYRYDASLGDGMRPALLAPDLAQVPFVWPGVDGFHYLRDAPADPTAVRDAWLGALEKAATRGGLFVLVCHAFVSGVVDARLDALEAVIEAALADPRVQVCTTGEVAASLLAPTGPQPA